MTIQLEFITLQDLMRGEVLDPRDAGYAGEAAAYNAAVAHRPDVVVAALDAADVVATVRWAALNSVKLSVQGTGHGAERGINGGVLVSTKRLRSVSIDPQARTATVGAGARWREVIDAAAPYGLAPLNGSSSDVGVAGYTLGGGLPVLGRTYGFAADSVLSLDIVTMDGDARTVSRTHEPELFDLLCGGGPGLAVVTGLTFRLYQVSEVYGGALVFDGQHAEAVLRTFAAWARTLKDASNTAIRFLRAPDAPDVPRELAGKLTVHINFAHVGRGGEQVLAPMRAAAPVLMDMVGVLPYSQIDRVYSDPEEPMPFLAGGAGVVDLDYRAIEAILALAGPDAQCILPLVDFRLLGGAMASDAGHTASAHGLGYAMHVVGVLAPPIADAVPGAIAGVLAAMAPFGNGHCPRNFLGDREDLTPAWSDEVGAKLAAAREALDPQGLLAH
ncbi:FAD-linked oxidase [Sinomonas cyclohexanicum]|uniref:FAD-linked oxidase n=1 Tax=Sinomonas cyclohexanicum TaxID=322009 RepID=A0ABM7PR02_SINCY|nr:FAD-binding oxidoreductase [Corynebacterium cyclohexanicum]BCT74483.1 FAD-linked oxidase [Corynebacterium cyclohexanicum]